MPTVFGTELTLACGHGPEGSGGAVAGRLCGAAGAQPAPAAPRTRGPRPGSVPTSLFVLARVSEGYAALPCI